MPTTFGVKGGPNFSWRQATDKIATTTEAILTTTKGTLTTLVDSISIETTTPNTAGSFDETMSSNSSSQMPIITETTNSTAISESFGGNSTSQIPIIANTTDTSFSESFGSNSTSAMNDTVASGLDNILTNLTQSGSNGGGWTLTDGFVQTTMDYNSTQTTTALPDILQNQTIATNDSITTLFDNSTSLETTTAMFNTTDLIDVINSTGKHILEHNSTGSEEHTKTRIEDHRNLFLIIGLVMAMLLASLLVVIVIIYKKRRTRSLQLSSIEYVRRTGENNDSHLGGDIKIKSKKRTDIKS